MIDFHSHILPGIDDGSKDVTESLAMLSALKEQGVDTVVATPHFYANHHSVEEFLRRRQKAMDRLSAELSEGAPTIVLGAEVRYYEGISHLQNLESLCIGDSKLLLLEMPFDKWTEYTVRELIDLSCRSRIRLVLAHIERYLRMQDSSVWDRLLDSGILMQVNASFFNEFRTRRKAVRMLSDYTVRFIGSDCHNMIDRPPQMKKAFDLIQKKLGEDFLNQLNDFASSLLV